ncbi:MAG: hypothetical protein GY835_05290 [bacterium]|nr:hypothetical protein [bacterium]
MKILSRHTLTGSRPLSALSLLFLLGGVMELGGVMPEFIRNLRQPMTALIFSGFCLHHIACSWRRGWRICFLANSLSTFLMATTILALLLAAGCSGKLPSGFAPAAILLHSVLLLSLLELGRLNQLLTRKGVPPAVFVVLGFLSLILLGAFLLMLPAATRGVELGFVDALFTSVSATCVTGLTVVETGSVFTSFGLGVLFLLFQIGGLGILTVTSFFALLLSRDLGTRERLAISENFGTSGFRGLRGLILRLVSFTFVIEALGALLLHLTAGPQLGADSARLGSAVFHAVSAFCNAGFSLYPDSLTGFIPQPAALFTVAGLIMIGGLGFLLCFELLGRTRLIGVRRLRGKRRRLSLQGRLVLIASLVLWIVGTLMFLYAEWNGALAEHTGGEKLLMAFFQSVTSRTAGFEIFPQTELSPAGTFGTTLLMFIGAAPGSTGGGIKVVTIVLTILLLHSFFRGRTRVDLAGRTIPETVIREALAVISAALFLVFGAIMALLLVEGTPLAATIFEAVSAFATVGLSTGLSAELGDFGKLMLALLMFCGRVGLLTVALGVSGGLSERKYRLPEEGVMIG